MKGGSMIKKKTEIVRTNRGATTWTVTCVTIFGIKVFECWVYLRG